MSKLVSILYGKYSYTEYIYHIYLCNMYISYSSDTQTLKAASLGGPSRALLIRDPWATQIVKGTKIWELRSRPTTIREVIGIALVGSSRLLGQVALVDCIRLDEDTFKRNIHKHRVHDAGIINPHGGDVFACVLKHPRQYKEAIPYVHPQGCIGWVHLQSSTKKVSWTICVFFFWDHSYKFTAFQFGGLNGHSIQKTESGSESHLMVRVFQNNL